MKLQNLSYYFDDINFSLGSINSITQFYKKIAIFTSNLTVKRPEKRLHNIDRSLKFPVLLRTPTRWSHSILMIYPESNAKNTGLNDKQSS